MPAPQPPYWSDSPGIVTLAVSALEPKHVEVGLKTQVAVVAQRLYCHVPVLAGHRSLGSHEV